MPHRSFPDAAPRRIVTSTTPIRASERFRPVKCVGSWQLTQLVVRGPFTDVYYAKPLGCPPHWPADYAVKLLSPQHEADPLSVAALSREAEVGSQVSHPHLISVLETHVTEPPYFVVMPKLEGASAGQVIENAGHFSLRQSLWVVRQVAEALGALHNRQWLHGDVKPANVMVAPTGHATLIDLGLAVPQRNAMLTADRTARGTLGYMAPEVMTSAYRADQRSDIYSLGISLFEMLAGRRPFNGECPEDLVEAHRQVPLPDPREFVPDLPREVALLIQRMAAKQPVRRPQTVRELIQELLLLEVAVMQDVLSTA